MRGRGLRTNIGGIDLAEPSQKLNSLRRRGESISRYRERELRDMALIRLTEFTGCAKICDLSTKSFAKIVINLSGYSNPR